VFLAPGGFSVFGPTMSGLVNLLVALALMYILFKIPFWILGAIRSGRGGMLGSAVKGFLAYKTFGLFRGRGGNVRTKRASSDTTATPTASPDPYRGSRTTANGQYVLPLPGIRRTRSTATPGPGPDTTPRSARARQLTFPLGEDWPENKPVLGHDGQYRLPLHVHRTSPPALGPPRPPRPPTGSHGAGKSGRQLELPFDPYKGNRPARTGQYPLPLDGVRRVRATANPPAGPAPPVARPRPGRQLRLPLELPKPAKPSTTPPTTPVFRPPPTSPSERSNTKPGGKTR
jgi:hypothetical protein